MGMFRIEITGIGGHGCGRSAKEGEKIERCGSDSCPDCLATDFVKKLANVASLTGESCEIDATGVGLKPGAVIRHWPSQENIVDDLLAGVRKKGHF